MMARRSTTWVLLSLLVLLAFPMSALAATTTANVVANGTSQSALTPTGLNSWYVTPGLYVFFNDNSNNLNYYYDSRLNPSTPPTFAARDIPYIAATQGRAWVPLAEGDRTLYWYALRTNNSNYDTATRSRAILERFDGRRDVLGAIGPNAKAAVPDLLKLTKNPQDGSGFFLDHVAVEPALERVGR
jgi:hypothetical protein